MSELEKINTRRVSIRTSPEFISASTGTRGIKQTRKYNQLKIELDALDKRASELEAAYPAKPKPPIDPATYRIHVIRPVRAGIHKPGVPLPKPPAGEEVKSTLPGGRKRRIVRLPYARRADQPVVEPPRKPAPVAQVVQPVPQQVAVDPPVAEIHDDLDDMDNIADFWTFDWRSKKRQSYFLP